MTAILRKLWHWSLAAIALVLIMLAVLLTVARLALPFAGEYRTAIEDMMTDYLGTPVQVGEFDVEWYRLGPRLRLGDVRIERFDGDTVRFDEARLDLGYAITEGEVFLRNVALTGVDVVVRHDEDGRLTFWGLAVDPGELRSRIVDGVLEPNADGIAEAGGLEDLFAPLLSVRRLQLLELRVLIPGPGGRDILVPRVDLNLVNRAGRHRLALTADLPAQWGERLGIRLDAGGDDAFGAPTEGRVHVVGEDLALEAFAHLVGGDHLPRASGRMDLAMWADWADGRPVRSHVDLGLSALRLGADTAGGTVAIDRAGASLRWRNHPDGWELHGRDLMVQRNGGDWRSDAFSIGFHNGSERPRWRGVIDTVGVRDVADIAELMPAAAEHAGILSELQPAGHLTDLAFSVGDDGRFALESAFTDLSWEPRNGVPGLSGLDGQLTADTTGARLQLATRDAILRAPGLVRDDLAVRRLEGPLRIDRNGDGLRLHSRRIELASPDFRAAARLDLRLAREQSPWFDMQVDFADGDAARTSHYLPAGVMSPALVDWLDSAIVDGRVTSGSMILRGRGADFPYDNAAGTFEVDFDVRDLTLDYAAGWPELAGVDARVRFHGRELDIEASRARLANVDFQAVQARFADLGDGELSVEGRSRADLGRMVDVVNNSPLAATLGGFFRDADAGGAADLALVLDIPVMDAGRTRARGELQLAGNHLRQPRFGLDIDAINGTARFSDSSLALDDLDARVAGRPTVISGWTDGEGLHVHARGEFTPQDLVPALANELSPWFDGPAPWLVRVNVPALGENSTDPRVIIRGESDLVGTHIDLPPPLDKPADRAERLRFTLPVDPRQQRQRLNLALGERLNLALEVDLPDGGGADLIRATAHLGPEPATLRTEGGIFISGDAGAVAIEDWQAAAGRLPGDDSNGVGLGTPGDSIISGADLQLDRLQWHRHALTGVRLQLRRTRSQWDIALASDQATGEIGIPGDDVGADHAWRLRFAHLDLDAMSADPEADGEDGAEDEESSFADLGGVDPAELPALDLHIDRLRVRQLQIESLALLTRPSGDGLIAHHLQAGGRALRVNGQGEWRLRGDVHRTRLRLPINATDLGSGLAALGTETAFSGGSGSILVEAAWHGRPWQPDLPSLEGSISVDLRDGVVEAVEPGPARLIGLFSVLAIPRRLALDFTDMTERGFTYDRIEGRINLHDGNAYTQQLEMAGPPGRIRVSGRAGYVAEDFDQRIVYRPAMSYSLPVLGTIAGGTGVGVAVLIAQGVLRGVGGSIDDIAELHYTLRGTWDEPELERVRRNLVDAPPQGQP